MTVEHAEHLPAIGDALIDDDDFRTAPILYRLASAFLHIDRKTGFLQHDCADDPVPQVFQFSFLHYSAGALASAFLSGFA
ncbi:hypothetical protein I7F98_25420 [Sinorhizobium meliloti]|nr:hypothetical protein [Sinorhizobium meliloti]